MEEWRVYFFLDARFQNVIKEWLAEKKVPKAQVAAFQEKIDTLEVSGPDMVPGFISTGPVAKHIYKLKIKGSKGWVQLRPMCCKGPFGDLEYTILCGAIEKDFKNDPIDAPQRAQDNRAILIADPRRRRRERIAGETPK